MGYDGLDRLTSANAPSVWGNASYAYDALDNLRTSTVGSRSATHGYDASNRLSALTVNGTATGYGYDVRGNITAKGSQGYYFDLGNRLQLASGKASYTYDGLGRRTSIAAQDGSTRVQVYDLAGELLYGSRTQDGVTSTTRYISLAGRHIAEATNNVREYDHDDALGSPVARTNAGAGITSRRATRRTATRQRVRCRRASATPGMSTTPTRGSSTCSSGTTIRWRGGRSRSVSDMAVAAVRAWYRPGPASINSPWRSTPEQSRQRRVGVKNQPHAAAQRGRPGFRR